MAYGFTPYPGQNVNYLNEPIYSPEVQSYIDQIYNYQAPADFSLLSQWQPYVDTHNAPASDEMVTDVSYPLEESYRQAMASGLAPENLYGMMVRNWGGARTPTGWNPSYLTLGNTYTLTDKNTGKTYTASTPEQMRAMRDMTTAMSGVGGNNVANWQITDAKGNVVASDLPYTPSFLKQAGQFIADQLPTVIGSMALPGAGGFITAGLGSMAGAGIKGADFLDALKAGALTTGTAALTSFGANKLFPAGTGSPFLDRALSIGNTDTLGFDSFVDAISGGFNATGGVGAYGPSTGSVSNVGGIDQVLVRPGAFYPGVGALAGVIPAQLTSGAASSPSYAGPGVEEVNVLAERAPVTDEYGASFLLPTGLAALSDGLADYDTGEQLGYGDKPTTEAPKENGEGLSTSDYIRLGLTGASLLGGLFGGSGAGAKDGTGTIPQGFSTALPSTFSAKLPTGAAIPAFGGGVTPESRMARTAADLGDIDYTRYGFGPERSFFVNVPQRAAKGGTMAAKPISDGRSDDIPAVLSDGEYVIDAETVALLGNGSNKAGAKQLDRFRANIRKHKGKELAKGRFSVDAKKPQAYMAGGRT